MAARDERLAEARDANVHLGAGRGNPNWVVTAPREAFFELGRFAVAYRGLFGEPPSVTLRRMPDVANRDAMADFA